MDTGEKVKAALKHIGVDMDLVHSQARLDTDIQIDSTEAVELVAAIRRFTGIVISNNYCKGKTVQELVDYIEHLAQAKSS